jgi:hypothetical protein
MSSGVRYTNDSRTDGFGSQFQSILWTLLYSHFTEKSFIYSDIRNMDLITNHGSTKDTEDENSLEDVINFMSIKNYVDTVNTDVFQNYKISTIPFRDAYNFIERNINIVHTSDVFLKFKKHFYENKKSRFDNNFINVAVHIRRMGIFEEENSRYRPITHDTPNSYYLNIMNLIRNNHHEKKLKFHIYSQGSIENFRDLNCDEDVVFHLNEKILDTFTDMMFANILITSASSLSYMAALLSYNSSEVHYQSFWHPPIDSWIVY